MSAAQTVVTLISILTVAGGWSDDFSTGFLAITTIVSFAFVMILLLRLGWFATALFLLFVLQPAVTVFVNHIWANGEPLWPMFANSMMAEPLRLIFVHLQIMMLCMIVAAALSPGSPRKVAAMPTLNGIGVSMVWVICGAMALAVLATALTTSRNEFVMDVQGGDRFVMVVGPLFIGLGAGLGLVIANHSMKPLSLFCLFAALLIALSGYRSVFVFAAMSFASAFLARRRVSWLLLACGVVAVVFAYEIMTILADIRARGASLSDVLSGSVPLISPGNTLTKAGAAEQIAVFTTYYAANQTPYFGATYLYAFVRALPNAIYTSLYIPPRIQDILVEGGPVQFQDVGLNLGAYFFAETFLNFGVVFSAGMTAFVTAILAWVENGRNQTVYRQMTYPGIVMLIPVLALYGSANFVKQTLTMLTFVAILKVIGIKLIQSTRANDLRTPVVGPATRT